MNRKYISGIVFRFFSAVVIMCLLLSGPLPNGVRNVQAQGEQGSVMPTVPTILAVVDGADYSLPPLIFEPTIILTPTTDALKSLELGSAGSGKLYRARVLLQHPHDLSRLKDWGIEILKYGSDAAYVQVTPEQLKKLARLGFAPSEIDSLSYMADVYNKLHPNSTIAESVLAADPKLIMTLSSVDTDSDGLTDTEEAWWCTNPNDNNTDSALAPSPSNPSDGDEVTAILNGVTAYGPPFALWPQFTPQNPSGNCPDGDYDSVPDNAEEYVIGLSNLRESTDLDKFDDGQELFGRTFCTGASGPCGYGILPRAEDSAFVSSTLPSWVKAPGNSPFVAAFPEPEVEVMPSSLVMTQKTIITNTKGTTVGTEKTYGTSTTKGTSTSVANQTTWNSWQEVSVTTPNSARLDFNPYFYVEPKLSWSAGFHIAADVLGIAGAVGGALGVCVVSGVFVVTAPGCGWAMAGAAGAVTTLVADGIDAYQEDAKVNSCNPQCPGQGVKIESGQDIIGKQSVTAETSDLAKGGTGTIYSLGADSTISSQPHYQINYPSLVPTTTVAQGSSRGGSLTTTSTQYEEQTISESSTNQFSENWSQSIATDPTHAADLRFTYHIVNNGTEYAREINSLTFNIYIGSDPNPAVTYCAIGSTSNCEIPSINNFFPGDSVTYTAGSNINTTIRLTDVQMRAIDEGEPVRVVMEDISFGMDQVFYQDIQNGSVLVAMEDGFDDLDETVDAYFIPNLYPTDTLQDVVKRYFPVTEDIDGNLLSVSTPEFNTNPPTFVQHSLTGTSWWNFYLSDGLNFTGAFADTLAAANSTVLVRIVSDRDLDGYNDRNEIRIGTDPDDPASHPGPNLLAGYTKSCAGDDCTLRMTFQNLGNYDAYGVEAVLYSPDGNVTVTNNTIGGSGRVPAGAKIVVGASDTFQYTVSGPSPKEPVIVVSYNDPQGNHRFVLPSSALIPDLNNDLTALNGQMLPDPGVDIASTDATHANFVIFSSDVEPITNGKLFVEYIDDQGNVAHEDTYTQNFEPGPTVIPVTIDPVTYPSDQFIVLAFFTDSQGNIIDSSARPLASFGADPLPEANLTAGNWQVGIRSAVVTVPDPWDFGVVEAGSILNANITIANSGMGELRYALTGLGNGLAVAGSASGKLVPTETRTFQISLDTAGLTTGAFNHSLTIRTNDPNHATLAINLTGSIGTPTGTATAYKVNDFRPWDQFVFVPGPHNQNDVVTFSHTLADDPARMFPLYLYSEDGATLKGVGEYGVDFSGQTAPFGVFGTGADGDLTVASGQTVYTDDTRSAVSATASSGQANISLSSSAGFAAGQEVLIIQIQGTGAGFYEFANIASVTGNTLTLTKNLTNTYAFGGYSKAQVIRVMNYRDLTVQGTLTAHNWDGSTGGIVVFRASGQINLAGGTITASYLGFRGGVGTGGSVSQQGESYTGMGGNSTGRNAGGGGGADYGFGGGGGGYGSQGVAGSTCCYSGSGGQGGSAYGQPELSQLFFGSGGGGGNSGTNPYGQTGGIGGGIVLIYSQKTNIISGTITSNGQSMPTPIGFHPPTPGNGGSGGGGGAGGSVKIVSRDVTLGTGNVTAIGGNGVDGGHGDSGPGGVGRIRVEYGILSGTTNPSANLQQVNYYSITGQGAPFGVFGNGSDGDLTVTTGQTVYTDIVRAALSSTVSTGATSIVLSSAGVFATNREILIIQMQGTGAGAYEFAAITAVNGRTVTLSKPLANTYTVGGVSKVQVLVIPQYNNVTIHSGGILTAHGWDGSVGGIVAFRASGNIIVNGIIQATGLGYRGGSSYSSQGMQGEGNIGIGVDSISTNGSGGGGGQGTTSGGPPAMGGGGGGYGTVGANGTTGTNNWGGKTPGYGGLAVGAAELGSIFFGGGGGGGGLDLPTSGYSLGGNGGGVIFIAGNSITVTGIIASNGNNGAGAGPSGNQNGGAGGGAGGSIFIKGKTVSLGTNLVTAGIGSGSTGWNQAGNGGAGAVGRIRIEYGTLSGTTNPPASAQQVNYYNLTGSSSNTLYLPNDIAVGSHVRYQLIYGQRGSNINGGDQSYTVFLHNRTYALVTLSALVERVAGSGSTFNFCLDIGNDGNCDYTANNQPFTGPVRVDSSDLSNALNTFIQSLGSSAPVLTIPIRVNISTPADIFLFNLSSTPGADVDLEPLSLTLDPPDNIQEGTLVTLSATVKNNSSYKAENFTVAFYYKDNKPGARDILIGATFIQGVTPGVTSPIQSVNWSTSGLLGIKTVTVKVDVSNKVAESNEANNVLTAQTTIKMKPDLVAASLEIPDARVGDTVTVKARIRNDGEGDANSVQISLYDDKPDIGNVVGSATVNVAAGASGNAQIAYTPVSAGVKKLYIKADPDNSITEANEGNNVVASTGKVGWSLLTVDAGDAASDLTYNASAGFGWLTDNTTTGSCGGGLEKSYRQSPSASPAMLEYQFDHLLPDRYYHLDLTFATCSGTRLLNLFVDDKQVSEFVSQAGSPESVTVITQPQTVSLLLDPADYSDGSIKLSIQRADNGLYGAIVNIIDLQEIHYCYRDSGPVESPWSGDNNCGYDSTEPSEGFDGWGTEPYQTIRFSDTGQLKYKFTTLDPNKKYNLLLNFSAGDSAIRTQQLLIDSTEVIEFSFGLPEKQVSIAIPISSYVDGEVELLIQRSGIGESLVSEVALEEDSRLENNRFPPSLPCYTLTKSHTGNGSDPEATPAYSSGCSAGKYHAGEIIALSASPSLDSIVGSWVGTENDSSKSTNNSMTMPSGDYEVIVNYEIGTPICSKLTLQYSGSGSNIVASPINSAGCASGNYLAGEIVDLTAYPAAGWTVGSWSGTDHDVSTVITNTVTKTEVDQTVQVNYVQQCYTLTVDHTGSGSNPIASPGNSAGCDLGKYHAGEQIQFSSAVPSPGWVIAGWAGTENNASKTPSNNATMPASDHIVSVHYAQTKLTTIRSIGQYDGWLLETYESSDKGGTINTGAITLPLGDDSAKRQYRSIMSFNTKGLPDNAVITRVTLKFKKQSVIGGGNPLTLFQGFMIDVRKGIFGSSIGLQASDFQAKYTTRYKTYGPFKPALVNSWYSINLTNAKNFINKLATNGGVTQFRLRFKLDDNNNSIANNLNLYSGNAPWASRPQLIIEYYVP